MAINPKTMLANLEEHARGIVYPDEFAELPTAGVVNAAQTKVKRVREEAVTIWASKDYTDAGKRKHLKTFAGKEVAELRTVAKDVFTKFEDREITPRRKRLDGPPPRAAIEGSVDRLGAFLAEKIDTANAHRLVLDHVLRMPDHERLGFIAGADHETLGAIIAAPASIRRAIISDDLFHPFAEQYRRARDPETAEQLGQYEQALTLARNSVQAAERAINELCGVEPTAEELFAQQTGSDS